MTQAPIHTHAHMARSLTTRVRALLPRTIRSHCLLPIKQSHGRRPDGRWRTACPFTSLLLIARSTTTSLSFVFVVTSIALATSRCCLVVSIDGESCRTVACPANSSTRRLSSPLTASPRASSPSSTAKHRPRVRVHPGTRTTLTHDAPSCANSRGLSPQHVFHLSFYLLFPSFLFVVLHAVLPPVFFSLFFLLSLFFFTALLTVLVLMRDVQSKVKKGPTPQGANFCSRA